MTTPPNFSRKFLRPKERTLVGNARILVVVVLIPLLASGKPAAAQSGAIGEDFLRDFHVVETIDGPANGRVTVRGTIRLHQPGLLTVQAVCEPPPSYLIVRDDEKSTQDLYPFEHAACIALLERLRANKQ